MRDAADVLGLSVDAVRKRVKRGTLESEKAEDGRLYVFLDTDQESAPLRSDTDRLISVLEEQLRQEREAHAEARRLLAAALERIPPQLEAPQDDGDEREGALKAAGSIVSWVGGVISPVAISVFSAANARYRLALVLAVFALLSLVLIGIGAYLLRRRDERGLRGAAYSLGGMERLEERRVLIPLVILALAAYVVYLGWLVFR